MLFKSKIKFLLWKWRVLFKDQEIHNSDMLRVSYVLLSIMNCSGYFIQIWHYLICFTVYFSREFEYTQTFPWVSILYWLHPQQQRKKTRATHCNSRLAIKTENMWDSNGNKAGTVRAHEYFRRIMKKGARWVRLQLANYYISDQSQMLPYIIYQALFSSLLLPPFSFFFFIFLFLFFFKEKYHHHFSFKVGLFFVFNF